MVLKLDDLMASGIVELDFIQWCRFANEYSVLTCLGLRGCYFWSGVRRNRAFDR